MNTLKEAFMDAMKKYFVVEGRATRPQYWYYILACFIIEVVLIVLGTVLGRVASTLGQLVGLILALFLLAVIIPSITAGVRRLHDAGFSGWFMLLGFVPIANIALLVMLVLPTKN